MKHGRIQAVAVAIVAGGDRGIPLMVLVSKRSEHLSLYPGHWQTPGGWCKRGETAWSAAVREVLEETGIDVSSGYETERVATIEIDQKSVALYAVQARDFVPRATDEEPHKCSGWVWVSVADLEHLTPSHPSLVHFASIIGDAAARNA